MRKMPGRPIGKEPSLGGKPPLAGGPMPPTSPGMSGGEGKAKAPKKTKGKKSSY